MESKHTDSPSRKNKLLTVTPFQNKVGKDSPDLKIRPRTSQYVKSGIFENPKDAKFTGRNTSNNDKTNNIFDHNPLMLEPINLDQIRMPPRSSKRNITFLQKKPSTGIDSGMGEIPGEMATTSLNNSARRSAQRSRSRNVIRQNRENQPRKVAYHPSEAELPMVRPSQPIKSARSRSKNKNMFVRSHQPSQSDVRLKEMTSYSRARFSNPHTKIDFQTMKSKPNSNLPSRKGTMITPSEPLSRNIEMDIAPRTEVRAQTKIKFSRNLSPNHFKLRNEGIQKPVPDRGNPENQSQGKLLKYFSRKNQQQKLPSMERRKHTRKTPSRTFNNIPAYSNNNTNKHNSAQRPFPNPKMTTVHPSRPVTKGQVQHDGRPGLGGFNSHSQSGQRQKYYMNQGGLSTPQSNHKYSTPRNQHQMPRLNGNLNIYNRSKPSRRIHGSGGMARNFGTRSGARPKEAQRPRQPRESSIESRSKAKSHNMRNYPENSSLLRTQTNQETRTLGDRKRLTKANSRSMSNLHEKAVNVNQFMTNSNRKLANQQAFKIDPQTIKQDFNKMEF